MKNLVADKVQTVEVRQQNQKPQNVIDSLDNFANGYVVFTNRRPNFLRHNLMGNRFSSSTSELLTVSHLSSDVIESFIDLLEPSNESNADHHHEEFHVEPNEEQRNDRNFNEQPKWN
jgi:hypothetical protein